MSNAPTYKGTGQPALAKRSGLLEQLGNLLGERSAPAYQGAGQPALRSAGFFAPVTPAYLPAPEPQEGPTACARDTEETMPDGTKVLQAALVCPAECDPFAQGPIAIIVPRKGR